MPWGQRTIAIVKALADTPAATILRDPSKLLLNVRNDD